MRFARDEFAASESGFKSACLEKRTNAVYFSRPIGVSTRLPVPEWRLLSAICRLPSRHSSNAFRYASATWCGLSIDRRRWRSASSGLLSGRSNSAGSGRRAIPQTAYQIRLLFALQRPTYAPSIAPVGSMIFHSINPPLRRCAERSGRKLLKLHGSAFAAMDALSCIINRRGDSQAGRRGFDPRLPLHSFQ